MNDLRLAMRFLIKNRGFCSIIILTLALGVGANTSIFSVINTSFFRTLPYPEPDRLMYLSEGGNSVSYPNFLDWQLQQEVFAKLAIYKVLDQKLRTANATELAATALVSADFFEVFGVVPAHGRGLSRTDDLPGAPAVAWVSDRAWKRLFAGDPALLGRTLSLDDRPVVVAGILPASFQFYRPVDIYVPVAPRAQEQFMTMRENHSDAYVLARLKPGVTTSGAQAAMTTIARRLEEAYPKANTGMTIRAVPLREHLGGWARSRLYLLFGAVGMVLLIACVNVGNMLLARALAREREIAVRVALGATRLQIIRQLLAESLVLAVAGGAVGLLIGYGGCQALWSLVPSELQTLYQGDATIELRVFLFTLTVACVAGLGFGFAPAWRLSRANPAESLKPGLGWSKGSRWGNFRASDALVVVQMGLAVLLLVGAGLMIRSLQRLGQVQTGFQAERVLTVGLTPPAQLARNNPLDLPVYYDRLLEEVRGLPGVESAAVASSPPFTPEISNMAFYREDQPVPRPGEFNYANSHFVTPDYFRTMGIPLLRGRVHTGAEAQPAMPPGAALTPDNLDRYYQGLLVDGLISQRMADKYWPGEDPVGKHFRLGYPHMKMPSVRVVGVVGSTTQQGLDRAQPAEFYVALRQFPFPFGTYLVLRASTSGAGLLPEVQRFLRSAVKSEPVRDIQPMLNRIEQTLSSRRFNTRLLTAFSLLALALGAVGLYGVLSFVVGRRTREVAVRMALGARQGEVLRGFLWRGARLALVGSCLGLGGAWVLSRWLQHQLFDVSAADPMTYGTGAALLVAVALVASLLPARRAARVEPAVALRTE